MMPLIDKAGEKTALEETSKIVAQIDANDLPKNMYRKLVSTIYDKQLKKYTRLNRAERHRKVKELFRSKNAK